MHNCVLELCKNYFAHSYNLDKMSCMISCLQPNTHELPDIYGL